jgi:hypothetical protein
MFVGAPLHAPPEARGHGLCTPATDVFGLAATAFETLTGPRESLAVRVAETLRDPPPNGSLTAIHQEAHVRTRIQAIL